MYLKEENKIWIATGKNGTQPLTMLPRMMNRHGLVTGATGTGKTTTIKVLAEAFSEMGTSVFMADIKGDVSGMCRPGEPSATINERVQSMGIKDFAFSAFPVRFFDVYGQKGIPVRTTVSSMGPLLLARILDLNPTQTGVLQIIFKFADDNGMLLLDFKDLRSIVQFAGDNAKSFTSEYGNVTAASVGAIQRSLLSLESAGADKFFGEPELDLSDWLIPDEYGRGVINILDCVTLFQNPLLYSTFLLWMLSELYEMLPEVGDLAQPKLVFFFDEAHLLFNSAPKALLQKVEQVIRLIRSKGVGIFFITQSPSDIPNTVLSQLSNKIQHALRAYTPNDQKAIKAAAASFRPNPEIDCESAISDLATGEVLLSVLDDAGAPGMIQRGFIVPPRCSFGVAEPELVDQITKSSPLYAKYYQSYDRYSAYEILQENAQRKAQQQELEALEAQRLKEQKQPAQPKSRSRSSSSPLEKALSSSMSQIGRSVSRELVRGLFGTYRK
ncbi:MAG: DUF853 domain-containing protein [Coriobacteriales bacterium]|jgi:DNA helicase HerA-like ATPase|nr:DUF853 domain-containing protein [Coriobacteriales bacterium]